jgi:hypothetical protein
MAMTIKERTEGYEEWLKEGTRRFGVYYGPQIKPQEIWQDLTTRNGKTRLTQDIIFDYSLVQGWVDPADIEKAVANHAKKTNGKKKVEPIVPAVGSDSEPSPVQIAAKKTVGKSTSTKARPKRKAKVIQITAPEKVGDG